MGNLHASAINTHAQPGTITLNETSTPSYTTLGAEFRVNNFTTGSQTSPAITALADGKFIVTWESNGQDGTDNIYARIYDANSNSLSSDFLVNTTTNSSQNIAAITALTNGNFIVAWQSDGQDGTNNIYSRIYDANGNPQTGELLINTITSDEQQNPKIAALANGSFVFTWESKNQDGDNKGVYARIYNANGVAQTGELLINVTTAKSQDSPAIAPLPTGGFAIAWQSYLQDGNQEGVYARIYNADGIAQTGELPINITTINEQKAPAISALANGNFVVTWDSREQDGNSNAVIGRIFNSNGIALTNEFQVNTYTTDAQDTSAIAALPDGGFLVTWESWEQDGHAQNSVYGQRFNPQGNPVGQEFIINIYSSNDQDNSAIAVLPDGGFVVAWESYLQDGSSNGIYSQRYAKVSPSFTPNRQVTGEFSVSAFKTRPNFSNGLATGAVTINGSLSFGNYPQVQQAINLANLVYSPEIIRGEENAQPTLNNRDNSCLPNQQYSRVAETLNQGCCDRTLLATNQTCLKEEAYTQMVGETEYILTRKMSWSARQAYWQERTQKQSILSASEYANYLNQIKIMPESERVQHYERLANSQQ
jgi:hypothetical protein